MVVLSDDLWLFPKKDQTHRLELRASTTTPNAVTLQTYRAAGRRHVRRRWVSDKGICRVFKI